MHRSLRIFALLLAAILLAVLAPAAHAQPRERCFAETGFCIGGRFLAYWERNGGLAVFGLPLGPERDEGGFRVQWFERERFELHPENAPPYDVLLGRLGDEALRRQGRDWRALPPGQPQPGCLFFEQTQRTLCEPFLSYWRGRGLEFDGRPGASFAESLALFGLPLSEPALETNSSGFTVLTQWFERARFEHLPENPPAYRVLLGRLGAELSGGVGATPTRFVQVREPGWPAPLEVPEGFTIEEVASGLAYPRFFIRDPQDGSLLVPEAGAGRISRLRDADGDGRYEQRQTVAEGFEWIHSLLALDGEIIAADEGRLARLADFGPDGRARRVETILPLPSGARDLYGHRTRTLALGPDGRLYLSVGSSCDACLEDTPLRAVILRLNRDGSGLEVFASGLRNTVGFAFHPGTGELWGADMGRNNLGPNLPPDELNLVRQGGDYGWPFCYGERMPDPQLGSQERCAGTEPPALNLPPHWAPLGVLFYDGAAFPAAYRGDMLLAFHGAARDQTERPGGYSVTRVRFVDGRPAGLEDLVRGWAPAGEVWGRPCGLLLLPDGSVLIGDDFGGRIFRLRYTGA
ncbi:MAG TPA: PQQ-dependent sugar dehydrogenase [Roseiflexaceae bacterium]|nr:PQQ-dependent sugar dehydrogenase [Roseiflexaceae bacterium]